MEFVCRRCHNSTKENGYRVTTQDGGVLLLNMLVCASCARLAKQLGLPAVKMTPAKKSAKAKRADSMTDGQPQPVQSPSIR